MKTKGRKKTTNTCKVCGGDGRTPARRFLEKVASDLCREAAVDGGEARELVHGLCAGSLTGISLFGIGADLRLNTAQQIIRAARLDPNKWGMCSGCGGSGSVATRKGVGHERI